MRELSLQEMRHVTGGGGGFYTDDLLIVGATIGFVGCMWLNSKRKHYGKPVGSWSETLNCTLRTSLEFGAAGIVIDLINQCYSQSLNFKA